MKTNLFLAVILILFSLTTSFSQADKSKNKCQYVLIDKHNYLFKMSIAKDSSRSSFSILKYKFRTKQLQIEYLKKLDWFDLREGFWGNFWCGQKPSIKYLDDESKICSIDDVSKEIVHFGSDISFIEPLNCHQYLVYSCFLLAEE